MKDSIVKIKNKVLEPHIGTPASISIQENGNAT